MGLMYKKTFIKNNGNNYPVNVEYYDSANELVDDLHRRTLKRGGWHEPHVKPEFTGCKNIEEAYEMLRSGYAPVVDKLNKEYKTNSIKASNGKRISFKNNICGYAPIVPLAIQGVPNSMISMSMKPIKTKVVDIYYDMTVNCGVEWKDIIETGNNILATVLDLESQGYRFNLYGVQTYSDSDNCDMLIVKIKDAKRPLDLRRMSFPLCHTGFFRLIGFDWYGKNPDSVYRYNYGRNIYNELGDKQCKRFAECVLGANSVYLCASRLVEREKSEQQNTIKEVLLNDC